MPGPLLESGRTVDFLRKRSGRGEGKRNERQSSEQGLGRNPVQRGPRPSSGNPVTVRGFHAPLPDAGSLE